jgi:hypothetical protein
MVVHDYGDDAGKGYDHQTKADTSIPYLVVCQALSPMVIDGRCRPGDLYNTVTEQVWKGSEGVLIVPATTRHVAAEWVPRDKGGGYRGQHEIESEIVRKAIAGAAKFGKWRTDEGNQLTETFYVYGAISSEDGQAESMFVMACTSTKIRPYKQWMTRIRQAVIHDSSGKMIKPPLYAHLTRLTTGPQKNDQGAFFVPVFKSADPRGIQQSLLSPNDERFMMAKSCMMLVDSGEAKVDFAQQAGDGDEDGGMGNEAGAPANVQRKGDVF